MIEGFGVDQKTAIANLKLALLWRFRENVIIEIDEGFLKYNRDGDKHKIYILKNDRVRVYRAWTYTGETDMHYPMSCDLISP